MRWKMFRLTVLGLLTGLSVRAGDASKADGEKIQGTWEPAGISLGGKPLPAPPKELPTRSFTGDKLVTKDPGKKGDLAVEEASFKLDATKEPRHIDITRKRDGRTVRGIYLLDGDTLKVAYHLGGEVRPTKFDGEGVFVETLKRQARK